MESNHMAARYLKALPQLLRLAQAMRRCTNSWLAILHEYSDSAAYEDDPVWKAERARA
jgi:hypothetical protein